MGRLTGCQRHFLTTVEALKGVGIQAAIIAVRGQLMNIRALVAEFIGTFMLVASIFLVALFSYVYPSSAEL
jgi:glycerol uptake facilitator-like aquaporin